MFAYEPTPLEAAVMSKHVYGDKISLIGGWKVSSATHGIQFNNSESGLKSALYERTVSGKTEYTYATAGTNDNEDLKNNGMQIIGASKQYKESGFNATEIQKQLGDAESTFTGHSLGGGEAEYNSLLTGDKAITFNAAGVSVFTSALPRNSNTDAYIMTTDPLNALQSGVGLTAGGDKHYLQPRSLSGVLNGHSINSVIESLSTPTVFQQIMNNVVQALTVPSYLTN